MSRPILVVPVVLLLVSACSPGPEPERAGNIDLGRAGDYFREFDELCAEDGGEMWGVSLCGPLLLVDPATRMVAANQPDSGGILEARAGVFAGELPGDLGIANTAMDWDGMRWTMIIWWALGGDPAARRSLMAHEAFHRLQPELGLVAVGDLNAHLDTAEGRFWMQMEWNALQLALLARGEARRDAVRDALGFRAARHSLFPEAAAREIPLEIFEGAAQYTGMRLAGFSAEEVVAAVTARREADSGFVRSFAYISGPLYGFLLDTAGSGWREELTPESDLAAMLATATRLSGAPADEAEQRAGSYGGAALRASEKERERRRMERIAAWRAALIDGPVLVVDLDAVTSVTFDPGTVFPIGEHQTVYGTRGLIAEWGRLSVSDGAILEDDATRRAHVSLAGAADDLTEGEGWTLELEEGWEVAPGERAGDRIVRRK